MAITEIKPAFPLSPAEFRILNKTVVENTQNTHSDSSQLKAELWYLWLIWNPVAFREVLFDLVEKSVDVIGYVL